VILADPVANAAGAERRPAGKRGRLPQSRGAQEGRERINQIKRGRNRGEAGENETAQGLKVYNIF